MRVTRIFIAPFVLLLFALVSEAQTCTTRGQTPGTAFPLCGNKIFEQTTVPICKAHTLKVPGCSGGRTVYEDTNPFWYKFTCYQSGTLGFEITPLGKDEDYDWQLFDITGHAPEDVFTNSSLTVAGNWAGTYGKTGTKKGGSNYIECSSDPADHHSTYAAMPNLAEGHNYLLLVSHFTETQSGYSITFEGGTASIIQVIVPELKDIRTNCEETVITLRLNKRIQCASLASDGSDFSINAPGVSVVGVVAPDCQAGFDADSLIVTLSAPLKPGDYLLTAKKGSDGNTLLDNCDFELEEGSSLSLRVLPKQPTPFDSIAPVSCAPQVVEFVFSKPIRCNSIAANGSDFSISGPNPVAIDGAYGDCKDGVTNSVFVHLAQPVSLAGTYTIATEIGNDGNVIVDECGQETPPLQSLSFTVKDTVSAAFTTSLLYGCRADTIIAFHDGDHDVNSWQWLFATDIHREGQTAQVIYDSYGEKMVTLIAGNGFCSDTASSVVNLDNELNAAFILPGIACPDEAIIIKDTSTGNIISYQWSFGNGNYFNDKTPSPQTYPQASGDRQYPVKLIVENNLHCFDTSAKQLPVAYSCHIAVPSAFTPNGDGINDYLYPLNTYKANNLLFTVYNRFGQVLFRTQDRKRKWDGTIDGTPQSPGTYVWTLQFTLGDTKQFVSMHGTSVLIR